MSGALSLGVVGHVDHGKTALVRALTGIETDRLREEQVRGLSIVLGFSHLDTAHGSVDLIDAPGHEDFVRTMISGATGIDGILLCIAANEGPMPQTVEHLNIARLLGVSRGIVAITKCDLADAETLAQTRRSIAELVAGTELAHAPVVECSATASSGIDELAAAIGRLAADAVPRPSAGAAFMPLDRVFTMHGFGLVVTGTLRMGAISQGDRLVVLPGGSEAAVRSLQIHGAAVDVAEPGRRVAVNLRGLGAADVHRGDVLATPGLLTVTRRIDAEVELLDGAPALRNGRAVQLMTGTTAVTAMVRLLDCDELAPGQRALVQWRLERPIATHVSERYIVRELSPRATVGGGRFIELAAERHRRFDAQVRHRLESLVSGDAELIARQRLEAAGTAGVDLAAVAADAGIDTAALQSAFVAVGAIEMAPGRYLDAATYADVCRRVLESVEAVHAAEPRRLGPAAAAVASDLRMRADSPVFRRALADLAAQGELRVVNDVLSRRGFDPFAQLGERERTTLSRIEQAFADAGLESPDWREITGGDRFRESLFRLLLQSGRLVRLRTYDRSAQRVLHADAVRDAVAAIAARYPYPAPFAVKDVRDVLGSTRRHVVPLLEHFDAIGRTERSGDLRRLRQD